MANQLEEALQASAPDATRNAFAACGIWNQNFVSNEASRRRITAANQPLDHVGFVLIGGV
jgi:hypothetical protein